MYESFYGLSTRPFALIPDSGFLFPSVTHRRALSYLIYGLGQREGFIVITGDIGTGKTLTIQAILDYLSTHHIQGARIAAANVRPDEVLSLVAAALGMSVQVTGKANLLGELERALLKKHAHGVLLIVDEAQTFSVEALEELRILSNMSHKGKALVQIALVGQSNLREVLNAPQMEQLHQRIIAWHQLEPFKHEETADYIQHRLKTAGWAGSPTIDPEIYTEVQEWTRGIPRKINILMDRFLLYGYLEEKVDLTVEDIRTVINEMQNDVGSRAWNAPAYVNNGSTSPTSIDTSLIDSAITDDVGNRLIELERSMSEWLGVSEMQDMLIDQEHFDIRRPSKEIGLSQRVERLERLFSKIRNQASASKSITKKSHN
ncbi:ExeA family protein [Acidihalobacter aeolianus]|uniref:ExeA family protein n=1 Tax=Acidihalobacter aeolianus TaxID=2792603 RepID=UPI0009F438FE|nr:AAA family ATPase [Acidihalobacter aeolianus]